MRRNVALTTSTATLVSTPIAAAVLALRALVALPKPLAIFLVTCSASSVVVALAAAGAAEDVAEDVAESLREAAEALGPGAAAAAHVGIDTGVAVLVVGGPLLRIGEHLVGFLGLLELLFGHLG